MFAIKIMSLHSEEVGYPNNDYQMISCDSYDVQYPNAKRGSAPSSNNVPIIGIYVQDGENKRYEGYPVENVAYIINSNGKTIDTIRP